MKTTIHLLILTLSISASANFKCMPIETYGSIDNVTKSNGKATALTWAKEEAYSEAKNDCKKVGGFLTKLRWVNKKQHSVCNYRKESVYDCSGGKTFTANISLKANCCK